MDKHVALNYACNWNQETELDLTFKRLERYTNIENKMIKNFY